jgi:hypothetical protein
VGSERLRSGSKRGASGDGGGRPGASGERVGTAAADRERGGASDGGGLFRAALGAAGPQLVWGDQGGGGTLETRRKGRGETEKDGARGRVCGVRRASESGVFFPFYTTNIYPSL